MLCKHIDDYLSCIYCSKDSAKLSNVVAVHCQTGRGKTGTAVCCYLMYSGRFDDTEEAI